MQTMLLISGLARRERDPWTAFSAALLALLAENPWSLRNVGLLLSFLVGTWLWKLLLAAGLIALALLMDCC